MKCSPKLLLLLSLAALVAAIGPSIALGADLPGLAYTNSRIAKVPWSIHVVQLERTNTQYQIQSLHAQKEAVGLDTLSSQLSLVNPAQGSAVAAINGDYYQREKAYAGAPRGLQIVDGELFSGPSGGASFWVDAVGGLFMGQIESQFQITWPDGASSGFGLNGDRRADGAELYTKEIGSSTHTAGGCEIVLARAGAGPWLPLRIGQNYTARVQEIRQTGDTPTSSNVMVLSLGQTFIRPGFSLPPMGSILRISTATQPALHGIKTAISGGPALIRNGNRQPIEAPKSQSYAATSMLERHPRAALGWNAKFLYLVEVDGRQKGLSVGMTLEELGELMANLGCVEAMNFDGGGSAEIWYDGQVRNSPCDRVEREIANCLVILKKK